MPLGAMLCKNKFNVFAPGDHASTYGGNPLGTYSRSRVHCHDRREVITPILSHVLSYKCHISLV